MSNSRNIFSYWNGTEKVSGDPLALRRNLTRSFGPNPKPMWDGLQSPAEDVRAEAEDRFLLAVREALNMTPFNSQTSTGALDEDVFAAYDAFNSFLAAIKKKQVT